MMKRKFVFRGESLDRAKEFTASRKAAQDALPPVPPQAGKALSQPVPENAAESTEHAPEAASAAMEHGAAVRTHIGRVRKLNEDAVICAPHLFGVADGMGGHRAGEVASGSTRDLLIEKLADEKPDQTVLENAIRDINHTLFLRQMENQEISGMGTTLTVLWEAEDHVLIGHVGDSRAYLLRDGHLEQMTLDHSMVAEMVRKGLLLPEDAETHPMRNVITRAVGTESEIRVDLLKEEKRAGDIWLICSDGLHGLVRRAEMERILKECPTEAAADQLLDAALKAGGRDNISLVIFPVRGDDHE